MKRTLTPLLCIIIFCFSFYFANAANFYAQNAAPAIWTNPVGNVWFDAPVAGNAYGPGIFPGTGDDVYTNGSIVILNIPSTCRNLLVESATANGLILAAPLTIEGTLLGWSENVLGFGFAYPSTPTAAVLGGGANITFTGISTGTAHFLFTANEVIVFWNQIAPIPSTTFNLGANTGTINQIGTLQFTFTVTPEDIRFASNVTVASGTLVTDNTSMTGVQIAAGTLAINTGATCNLTVPLNNDGTNTSRINGLSISGTLNATDAGAYINSQSVTLGSGSIFITNYNGVNQTEGWWHSTTSPTDAPAGSVDTLAVFDAVESRVRLPKPSEPSASTNTLLPNVRIPAMVTSDSNSRLLFWASTSKKFVIALPITSCRLDPSKVVRPPVWLKPPLLVKLPPTFKLAPVMVKTPFVMVKSWSKSKLLVTVTPAGLLIITSKF